MTFINDTSALSDSSSHLSPYLLISGSSLFLTFYSSSISAVFFPLSPLSLTSTLCSSFTFLCFSSDTDRCCSLVDLQKLSKGFVISLLVLHDCPQKEWHELEVTVLRGRRQTYSCLLVKVNNVKTCDVLMRVNVPSNHCPVARHSGYMAFQLHVTQIWARLYVLCKGTLLQEVMTVITL